MEEHGFHFQDRVATRQDVYSFIAKQVCNRKALYMEFGVYRGASMRWWSRELKHRESILHGFDSFQGLPIDGGIWSEGQFNTAGVVPIIADARVKFFKGWFEDVLPSYVVPPHEVLIINMDADLYSSTLFVLRNLRPHIKRGIFIYFDEINHIDHEARALDEFLKESGIKLRAVCADKTMAFVFFECVD